MYDNYFIDIVLSGPDTWLTGNIIYIKRKEIDDNDYTINIKYIKLKSMKINSKQKKQKDRPSPSESATLYNIGYKKKAMMEIFG